MPIELLTAFGPILAAAATIFIAFRQLRQEREHAAIERALQTRREVLLAGVRAISKMTTALGSISNPAKPQTEITQLFTEAISDWIAASAVASIRTVERGRDFIGDIAPRMIKLQIRRQLLEHKGILPSGTPELMRLAHDVVSAAIEVNKPMLLLISSVRHDIEIKDATDAAFLAAAMPNHAKIRKLLGMPEPKGEAAPG